ncbi:MAG TPA: carbon-nitrogen hydrolase family protein, partial [Cytophagaceae bacterium]
MKIALAQTKSVKGNIPANIIAHQRFIDLAVKAGALAVFFPELSLTGYEPALANELALELNDSRLDPFDAISLKHNITIGFGAPIRTGTGVQIAMLFFQPGKPREIYSKQQLHSDEMPFFEAGSKNLVFELGDKKLVPAICYESLQNDNADMAKQLGAEIYLASVAKAQT